jgi:hypothetical protein
VNNVKAKLMGEALHFVNGKDNLIETNVTKSSLLELFSDKTPARIIRIYCTKPLKGKTSQHPVFRRRRLFSANTI